MYARILKKDLKRKIATNVIITLFVILATMFITSSVTNLALVSNGVDHFFEIADVEDFIFLTMRENYDADATNEKSADSFLENEPSVTEHSTDSITYATKENVALENGKSCEMDQNMILSMYQIKQQKFFDFDNKLIENMREGTIYLPDAFMKKNSLKKGDELIIKSSNGFQKKFEIAGPFKDAGFGAEMVGTHRFLMTEKDYWEITKESGLPYGQLYSIKTDNLKEFKSAYSKQEFNPLFGGDKALFKITYIMDEVIAATLILVSICLILISAVMLRFIIIFTVNEDFKEIGIMKAIGIPNGNIRKMYVFKYFALSVIGAAIGFIGGIPFGKVLLKSVENNIVMDARDTMVVMQVFLSILVVLTITGFARLCTKRINKMTPMDAIRNGNTGERFRKKGFVKLSKSHLQTTSFMAVNDVLCEKKKYIMLLLTSVLAMWLITMPINTINTLGSEEIATTFSLQPCDFFVVDDVKITEVNMEGTKEAVETYLLDTQKELVDAGIPVEHVMLEMMFRYRIEKGDNAYTSIGTQGFGTDIEKYNYDEGEAPKRVDEVALGYTTAENIDATVGDKVSILMNGEKREFYVSGLFQSLNNMGEGIRFHNDAQIDYKAASGGFGVQVILKEGKTVEETENYIAKTKDLYPGAKVKTTKEFMSDLIGGISERLEDLKLLIVAIVILICVMVVVLMQKLFVIREKGQLGMLKAIGFSNRTIIAWQAKRVGVVLLIGTVLGIATATPFSRITAGQVFRMMGAKNIQFVVNPLEVYVAYPLVILGVTLLACVITMLSIRKITVQNMDLIE